MWFTASTAIWLGLTALGGGTPCARRSTTGRSQDEFTLAMTVNSSYVELTAVSNGTDLLVLQANNAYRGTSTYSNTTATNTNYNTSLVFDLSNSTTAPAGNYGLYVPDLGSLYGATANVLAQKDYQDFGFQVDEGAIYHTLTSASQTWFACTDTVNGTQGVFLRWGLFTSGGGLPDGCSNTNLVQVNNARRADWGKNGRTIHR